MNFDRAHSVEGVNSFLFYSVLIEKFFSTISKSFLAVQMGTVMGAESYE